MANWLLLGLLLACPLMMVFMMRGMHSGHGSSVSAGDGSAGARESDSPDTQASDARIAQLERELASLRSAPGDQPDPASGRRS